MRRRAFLASRAEPLVARRALAAGPRVTVGLERVEADTALPYQG